VSNISKFIIVVVFILFLGFIVFKFIAQPRYISGGNPSSFKEGETVLVMSKPLYNIIGRIKTGDVITFRRSDMTMEGIAAIVGFPGGEAGNKAYYFSNEKVGKTIPSGYTLVRMSQSEYFRAIPESEIIGVVWYSFKLRL
jgi:hypothetical protein